MKHTLNITFLLLSLFIATQLVGLAVVQNYVQYETVVVDGEEVTEQSWSELPYAVERPEFEPETSYIPIIILILVATGIILLLVKFQAYKFWQFWFFLSVWFCLVIALGAFFTDIVALVIGLALAVLKIVKRNLVIHNITELFIYGGLAAIFVPVFNLFSISMLLILIAIYDFIAVHKTKHMVKLAKFQTKSKLFAGLLLPYGKDKTAVLGGGDVAFPLMFTAVIMGMYGLSAALLVVLTSTLGLGYLLWKSEKNKFYPAMPFIAAGCFIGYGLLLLL